MTEELKELVSKADRGDDDAQRLLMNMAQEKQDAGDCQEAAELFKLAAMAYRIAEGRTSGILADTARTCGRFAATIRLYDEWVKNYTKPVAPRINRLKRFKGNFDVPVFTLRRDDGEFGSMLRYLEKQLMDHDVESCTGSTINKLFYYMVQQRDPFWNFIHDIDMRVVLDPIADEVLRLLEHPDSDDESP